LLGEDVISESGDHPDFYGPVWCAVALELLGMASP
jgi:hypothetical protein